MSDTPAAQTRATPRPTVSPTIERMRRVARSHQDPKVREYARRWLEARGLDVEGAA